MIKLKKDIGWSKCEIQSGKNLELFSECGITALRTIRVRVIRVQFPALRHENYYQPHH